MLEGRAEGRPVPTEGVRKLLCVFMRGYAEFPRSGPQWDRSIAAW